MWIFLIIVLVLLILFTSVLLSKIKMDFRLRKQREAGKHEMVLEIKMLFDLIRVHYEIPLTIIDNVKKGLMITVEEQKNVGTTIEKKETDVNKRKIDFWKIEFSELLQSTESLKRWINRTLSRLSVQDLHWSTQFSSGDAAYTGIATGLLWSTKAYIVGWLSSHVQMKITPELFVVPDFDDKLQFSSEISCTAEISLGYMLYAGLVLFFRVLKVKGGVKQWGRILFKGKVNES